MKRISLYLLLFPLIASPIAVALRAIVYEYSAFWLWDFVVMYEHLRQSIFLAYLQWLLPALAIAIIDWLCRGHKTSRRLGEIATTGFVSILFLEFPLYGASLSYWLGMLLPGVAGAVAALICCFLLDQLTKEHLCEWGAAVLHTLKALRRWPYRSPS